MLLKINNNDFINLTEEVEVEKQANLFQDITEIDGDFSYSFTLPNTNSVRDKLGIQSINSADKSIYQKIDCSILDDSGQALHMGFLRVESIYSNDINCSFFSGNSNWIDSLSGPLIETDLSAYNVTKAGATIITSWSATSGVIFPLMDTGLLSDRVRSFNLETEDFHPCIYVKDVITAILNRAGLKLSGEILTDKTYNSLIMTSKSKSATEALIRSRSCKAGKTSSQAMDETFQKITFTDDSNTPFYDGSKNNYSTVDSRYTADVGMKVKVECYIKLDAVKDFSMAIYKNGTQYPTTVVRTTSGSALNVTASQGWVDFDSALYITQINYDQPLYFDMDAGDYIEIFFALDAGEGTVNITSGYFLITPAIFKTTLPESILPDITQAEFVAGIFSLFNPVVEFDVFTQTIEVNLFNNMKNRSAMDWSRYINPKTIEENYVDFIQDYGKKNNFNYEEGNSKDIETFNKQSEICYGCGQVEVDNYYLEPSKDLSFPFHSVPADFNTVTGAYIPKFKFLSYEDFSQEVSITSVTSGTAGKARFTTSINHGFVVGDWVRIISISSGNYLGQGKISQVPSATTFEIFKLMFSVNATGTVILNKINDEEDDSVYLMLNISNYALSNFSENTNLAIEGSNNTHFAYCYFDKPSISRDLDYIRQVVSFDPILTQNFNGIGLLQTYFTGFRSVLSDPVMLKADFHLPYHEYHSFRFKYPIRINTDKHNGLFYVNRITGYKGSHLPCEVELIKL